MPADTSVAPSAYRPTSRAGSLVGVVPTGWPTGCGSVDGGVDMVTFILVDMTPIYTTTVHATGDGRNGHVSSDDGNIDLRS